jgi:hypothetical protein
MNSALLRHLFRVGSFRILSDNLIILMVRPYYHSSQESLGLSNPFRKRCFRIKVYKIRYITSFSEKRKDPLDEENVDISLSGETGDLVI